MKRRGNLLRGEPKFIEVRIMTPSSRAKELGAQSLKQVAQAYGCTVQNLNVKFKRHPRQFDIIVRGVVATEYKS